MSPLEAIAALTIVLGLPTALLISGAYRVRRRWYRDSIPFVERVRVAHRIEETLRAQPEPPRAVPELDLRGAGVPKKILRLALEHGRLAELPYASRWGTIARVLPEGRPELLAVVDARSGKPLLALGRIDRAEEAQFERWQER